MSADRTVHAETDQMEIVRYDRAGRWYLEPKNGMPRQQVPLRGAVQFVRWAKESPCGLTVHAGRSGGSAFDRAVEAVRT